MNHAQLTALGRALRLLGEHGDALTAGTTNAQLHEMRSDLKRALDLLDETVTTAKPTTKCPEHPTGPVDENAVDLCLLCETRRRTARRSEYNGSWSQPPAPDRQDRRTQTRYGVREDRPGAQQRWIPEAWTGQAWQLCGTPRRERDQAEQYLAAERHKPQPAMAYRLVHEFTDYEVARVWGTPVTVDLRPMGPL